MILCLCPNPSIDTFIWVKSLRPGEVHRASNEKKFPGGKGVHVALAVAELGEDVALLGFWAGAGGNWIKSECEKRGVRCIGPELSGEARTCITFKAEDEYDDTEVLGCGSLVEASDCVAFLRAFESHLPEAACVTLSGSWPRGAPDSCCADLVKLAALANQSVYLDCTGKCLDLALREAPFAIHLNKSESEGISGIEAARDNALHFLNQVEMAAITNGAEGLWLAHGDLLVHASVRIDNVFSAVGSGDCLLAGLAVAKLRQLSLRETAAYAVACGGANCLREDLGMLYRRDVENLLSNVTTEISTIQYAKEI